MEVGVSFLHIWISRSSFLENVSLVCLGFHNRKPGNSMAAQWWRLSLPLQGAWVQSLVREVKSCKLHGQMNRKKTRLVGLSNRHLFSHSSEIQKFIIKVATRVVYGEAFVPGWREAAFTLSPHTVLQLCMFKERSFPLLARSPGLLD